MSSWGGEFKIDSNLVKRVGRPYREEVTIMPEPADVIRARKKMTRQEALDYQDELNVWARHGIPDGTGVDHEDFFVASRPARKPSAEVEVTVARAIIARTFLTGVLVGWFVALVVVWLMTGWPFI